MHIAAVVAAVAAAAADVLAFVVAAAADCTPLHWHQLLWRTE